MKEDLMSETRIHALEHLAYLIAEAMMDQLNNRGTDDKLRMLKRTQVAIQTVLTAEGAVSVGKSLDSQLMKVRPDKRRCEKLSSARETFRPMGLNSHTSARAWARSGGWIPRLYISRNPEQVRGRSSSAAHPTAGRDN